MDVYTMRVVRGGEDLSRVGSLVVRKEYLR